MNEKIQPTRHMSPADSSEKANPRRGRATGRVSKQQWLDMALGVLCSNGIEDVRVVNLAEQLNISKSGFYWHFKNREELLDDMKAYWVEEFSQKIISEVLNEDKSLHEKILMLAQMIREKKSGQFDLAFTAWAQRDPSVQELVDGVRDIRVVFVKKLLADTGCIGIELEARARLLVVYFSWSEIVFGQKSGGLEGEPLEEIAKILAGPPAS